MQNEQLLGFFTLASAFFGCITNWSVVIFFRCVPSLRSSFGVLSAHGAFVTAVYCSLALFWIAPIMLLDVEWLLENSHHAGFVLYLFYDLATETHFLICLNRFFAVSLPHKYHSVFTVRSTAFFLSLLWIVCLLISVSVFPLSGCRMYYEKSLSTLVYTWTPTCQNLTFFADFEIHMSVVSIMVVLNSFTFYRFRKNNKMVSTTLNQASSFRKSKSERNFLKQTLIQETAYVIALLTYFWLGSVLEGEWIRFLVILLPWYFLHAFEGMVTILCNPELKKLCFQKWKLCFDAREEPHNAPARTVGARRSTTSHVSAF